MQYAIFYPIQILLRLRELAWELFKAREMFLKYAYYEKHGEALDLIFQSGLKSMSFLYENSKPLDIKVFVDNIITITPHYKEEIIPLFKDILEKEGLDFIKR